MLFSVQWRIHMQITADCYLTISLTFCFGFRKPKQRLEKKGRRNWVLCTSSNLPCQVDLKKGRKGRERWSCRLFCHFLVSSWLVLQFECDHLQNEELMSISPVFTCAFVPVSTWFVLSPYSLFSTNSRVHGVLCHGEVSVLGAPRGAERW